MGASVTLVTPALQVEPGQEVSTEVRVRNTGTVVDEFALDVLGDAAGWAGAEPGSLSLFPGAEGTAKVVFRPPRAASTPAGLVPFGVRARSREDPAGSAVEEGSVTVGSFQEPFAELVPRTSRGSRGGGHDVAIDNRGNARLSAELEGTDADRVLRFDIKPPGVVVEPGMAGFAKIRVSPVKRFWRGQPKTRPFQLYVRPEGGAPISLDGTLLQESMLPPWFLKALLALIVLLVLLVLAWLFLLKPSIETAASEAVASPLASLRADVNSALGAAGLPTMPGQRRRGWRSPDAGRILGRWRVLGRWRHGVSRLEHPGRTDAHAGCRDPGPRQPGRRSAGQGHADVHARGDAVHHRLRVLEPQRRLGRPGRPAQRRGAAPAAARQLPRLRPPLRDADRHRARGEPQPLAQLHEFGDVRPSRLLLRIPAALRPGTRRAAAIALALALLSPAPAAAVPSGAGSPGGPSTSAPLPPPPGTTTLVSQRRSGGFPNGGSAGPSISENGRYVAFTSAATNLVGAASAAAQVPSPAVFVRDRRSGSTIRLPLPGGFSGGGAATEPSISSDGNVVAFTYQPPTTNLAAVLGSVVLAWDRHTGKTAIVSRTLKGSAADHSHQPSVSANGRYIAYTSENPSIAREDGQVNADVFRYDRTTQQTILVSVGTGGRTTSGNSTSPSISGNGNVVAFASDGGDTVVAEDTGAGSQVYVRTVGTARTERISGPPGGGAANGASAAPSISADGRYVAFESAASNLAPGDDGRFVDVFRRDRQTGTTVQVSVTPAGAPGGGASGQAAISRDGRMVAFASAAPDIVDTSAALADSHLAAVALRTSEVFERDVEAGETILVSVATTGGPGGSRSLVPAVGGGGRYVTFASLSSILVTGDKQSFADVFLRDFPPAPRLNPTVLDLGSRAVGTSALPAAAVLANTGWSPLTVSKATITGSNRADFGVTADGCDGRTLHRGEACTVTIDFTPKGRGLRTATLEIPDSFTGSPRTARLRGSGSRARLVLDPDLGPPGIVTIATGTGFPPGSSIRLRWSNGLTPRMPVVKADCAGPVPGPGAGVPQRRHRAA